MKKAKSSITIGAVATAAFALSLFGETPVVNIDFHKHPALWNAQKSIVAAYEKLGDAQKATGGDFGGHAQRAKELLSEADKEVKLAAKYANQH